MLSELPERRKPLHPHAFMCEVELEEGTDPTAIEERILDSVRHMDHVGRVRAYYVSTLPDGAFTEERDGRI